MGITNGEERKMMPNYVFNRKRCDVGAIFSLRAPRWLKRRYA